MIFKSGFVLALLGSFAANAAVLPLEDMKVKEVVQSGDFMPPTTRTAPTTKIKVEVMSNGCTLGKHFEVEVKNEKGLQLVSIVRTTPDTCRRVGAWEEVEVETDLISHSAATFNRAGLRSRSNGIVFLNPFAVDDQTTH